MDYQKKKTSKFVVHQCDNLTAYADFNEDTFEGPTSVTNDSYYFNTFEEAYEFYKNRKNMLRVAGTAGMYYTYPVKVKE